MSFRASFPTIIAVTILVSTAAIAPSPGTISSKFRILNLPLTFYLNLCVLIQQLHLSAWIQGENLLRIGILCYSPMPGWRSLPQLERRLRMSDERHFQRRQQHHRVHEPRNRWSAPGEPTGTNCPILFPIETRRNCFDDPERSQSSRPIPPTGYRKSRYRHPLDLQKRTGGQRKSPRIATRPQRLLAFRLAQFARQFFPGRISRSRRPNHAGRKRVGNDDGSFTRRETSAGRNDHLSRHRKRNGRYVNFA